MFNTTTITKDLFLNNDILIHRVNDRSDYIQNDWQFHPLREI